MSNANPERDEEVLSNLGEGPVNPESGLTGDDVPTAEAERRRERMMRTTSEDLPFGGEPLVGTRIWLLVAAAILLALAIPIFYVFVGLGSATVVNGGWFTFAFVTALVVLVIAGGGIFAYSRLRTRGVRRDDFGNVLRDDDPGTDVLRDRVVADMDADRTRADEERVRPPRGGRGRRLEVRSFMRRDPVICGNLDSIYDCAKDMYAHNVGYLIVLDADDRCVGVVSDRDLVCGGLAEGFDPKSTPVTTIMEPDFKFVGPEHSLEECLGLMQNDGIRRVPVLESGVLIGIVTLDDLIIKRLCTIEEAGIVLKRQLAEPGIDHGLSERKLGEHKLGAA